MANFLINHGQIKKGQPLDNNSTVTCHWFPFIMQAELGTAVARPAGAGQVVAA
jgi:hypothetical protein